MACSNSTNDDKLLSTYEPKDNSVMTVPISLKDLINKYRDLHGQKIQTEGIVWFQFENFSVCPTKNSLFDEEEKCFWLDFHPAFNLSDSLMHLASGKWFTLRGTVDTTDTGHLGYYVAALKNIDFLQQITK
jgi:hypothetical protein